MRVMNSPAQPSPDQSRQRAILCGENGAEDEDGGTDEDGAVYAGGGDGADGAGDGAKDCQTRTVTRKETRRRSAAASDIRGRGANHASALFLLSSSDPWGRTALASVYRAALGSNQIRSDQMNGRFLASRA